MTALRSVHLVGVGGCGGAFLYDGPRDIWVPFLALTVVSGLAMVLLEVWSSRYWIIELRGIAIVAKVLLLSLAGLSDGISATVFIAAILISGIFAHAPAAVRYFSVYHRRRTH
jgi:hypothetical protein